MEVHAHSHTPRIKWTHYIWEFIMLFLAVFCGFLAENIREHTIEKERGKEYIKSLIEDIKIDTANINSVITISTRYLIHIDTLLSSMNELRENGGSEVFMRNNRFINSFQAFIYTDRTMQQLKNSGGLRLIQNKDASDSIIFYDSFVRDMSKAEEDTRHFFYMVSDQKKKLIDFNVWQNERKKFSQAQIAINKTDILITHDKQQFSIFYNYIDEFAGSMILYNDILSTLKEKGTRLIAFLKKEYHLE